MPTYDYECGRCGHRFEAFQAITAPPLSDCPECKRKKALKRLIGTGAGLIFKGTGFYCTDYKSTSSKQDESVDRHKKAAKEVKESTGAGGAQTDGAKTSDTPKPGAKTDGPTTKESG